MLLGVRGFCHFPAPGFVLHPSPLLSPRFRGVSAFDCYAPRFPGDEYGLRVATHPRFTSTCSVGFRRFRWDPLLTVLGGWLGRALRFSPIPGSLADGGLGPLWFDVRHRAPHHWFALLDWVQSRPVLTFIGYLCRLSGLSPPREWKLVPGALLSSTFHVPRPWGRGFLYALHPLPTVCPSTRRKTSFP